MTTSLVSLSEIKTYIPTRTGFAANDARYHQLALQATASIEKLCRCSFAKKAYIQYFDSMKTGKQFLDLYGSSLTGIGYDTTPHRIKLNGPVDLTKPFEVYYDPQRSYGAASKLAEDEYILDAEKGELIVPSYTDIYLRAFKVVYTGGYEVNTVDGKDVVMGAPEDLKQAALLTISFMFDKANFRSTGTVQKGDTDQKADYYNNNIIPPEAMQLIIPYKRFYVKGV